MCKCPNKRLTNKVGTASLSIGIIELFSSSLWSTICFYATNPLIIYREMTMPNAKNLNLFKPHTLFHSENGYNIYIGDKILSCLNGRKSFSSFAKNTSQNFSRTSFRPLTFDNGLITTSTLSLSTPNHLKIFHQYMDRVLYTIVQVKSTIKHLLILLQTTEITIQTDCSSLNGFPAVAFQNCSPILSISIKMVEFFMTSEDSPNKSQKILQTSSQ